MRNATAHRIAFVVMTVLFLALLPYADAQPRVIELTADHDSRYKMAGQPTPEITGRAGEQVLLRVTARKGKAWNRGGSMQGFALLRPTARSKVAAWAVLSQPRTQEVLL